MSEAAQSAGALLRAAREKQGLHIAALATMLKVPPRKLEALEADRYDEFQGATFVRALAQAACRTLKVDPAPVLDRLPEQDSGNLSQLERGLNTPFRERGARRESSDAPLVSRAVMGLVVVLLLGALAFLWWPANWRLPNLGSSAAAPESSGTSTVSVPLPATTAPVPEPTFAPAPAPAPMAMPEASAPALAPASQPEAARPLQPAAPSAAAASAPMPAPAVRTVLQLTARAASWIEVVDGRSQVLLARTLAPGEAVGLDGVLPLRVKIGNVAGTQLSFQGKPVDLTAAARDNVAKLELK
ncbi:helix-turn-helix domain-containing protein [Ideonella sp.]|uniref:helix-turn-helix domain-containing protein n=1 Tax=Ideonella sp. TaxID=1929293 RepID=UPI002B47452A|nr:helix-turn-helix domain-containing protein [Ideonella sp.]HJV72389.1 helix-turn-helix domain-containing protein [Ideonella sp.]